MSKKRVLLNTPLQDYLNFLESTFHVLPVTARIAQRSVQFGRSYPRDPADQIIGATAIVHQAVLVTKDREIRDSGEVNCVW